MTVDVRMTLWFGVTWFTLAFFDYLWPPANHTFNAALSILTTLTCYARHRESTR